MSVDVLFYVEDPGAANFIASLPMCLKAQGIDAVVLAHAHAKMQLQKANVDYIELTQDDDAEALIERFQPTVFASGTTDRIESVQHALIAECHRLDITTVGLVDGPASYEYRFRGNGESALSYCPSWLMVVDQATALNYQSIGVSDSAIRVIGHPHYDAMYEAKEALAQEDRRAFRDQYFPGCEQKKVIVFAAEISTSRGHADHSAKPDDSFNSVSGTTERTKILLENFLEATSVLTQKPFLVLRLHPKNTPEEFSDYQHQFDLISEGGRSIELVYAADMVVGITSILLEETAILGTPVVSMIRREQELDWLRGIDQGIIPVARNRQALETILMQFEQEQLAPIAPESILAPGACLQLVQFFQEIV